MPIPPSEATEALILQCRSLQKEYEGRRISKRQLLLRLKTQIEPLIEAGICRRDIWLTIRSTGLQVSEAHLSRTFSEVFGNVWQPTRKAAPSETALAAGPEAAQQPTSNPSITAARPIPPDIRMSFGDQEQAQRQQERLARVRASIEEDRARIRQEKEERERVMNPHHSREQIS